MENNEIMVNEAEVMNEVVNDTVATNAGMSNGLAMALGSALTLAVLAGGKKLIKVYKDHKAKKAVVTNVSDDGVVIDVDATEIDDK